MLPAENLGKRFRPEDRAIADSAIFYCWWRWQLGNTWKTTEENEYWKYVLSFRFMFSLNALQLSLRIVPRSLQDELVVGSVREGHSNHFLGRRCPKALRHEDGSPPKQCRGKVDVVECDRSVVEGVDDVDGDEVDVLGKQGDEVVSSKVRCIERKNTWSQLFFFLPTLSSVPTIRPNGFRCIRK